MKKLLLLMLLAVVADATTLTGTLNAPDGTGLTGTLVMSLSQQGALSAAGGCGGPILVLPTYQIRIRVVSGNLIAAPSIYGTDCLLPAGIYYNVQVLDSNNNVLFTDKWLIQGSTQNIGAIISVVVSGTAQTLGQSTVISTNPLATQTVTQPASTYLGVNALAVTGSFTFPDGSGCNSTYCQFGGTEVFLGGIQTAPTSSSLIYVGSAGQLFLRGISGADFSCVSGASPTGNDGFFGYRIDTKQLQICQSGHLYASNLTLVY